MGNAVASTKTDARFGAVPGDLALNAPASPVLVAAAIIENQPQVPWRANAPLSSSMKSLVGDVRYITGVQAMIDVSGDLPLGLTSNESFLSFLRQQSNIKINVLGVTKAIYTFAQMEDTRFMQRQLDIILLPDPTLFTSVIFELTSSQVGFPRPPTDPQAYTINFSVNTYWSKSPSKESR